MNAEQKAGDSDLTQIFTMIIQDTGACSTGSATPKFFVNGSAVDDSINYEIGSGDLVISEQGTKGGNC